jgi:hypothetical protein
MENSVMTIRISKEVQAKMKKYKGNWSQEVRDYIESRIKARELEEVLAKIGKANKHRRITPNSTQLIREDRDSR